MFKTRAKKLILITAAIGLLIFFNYLNIFYWPKNLIIKVFLPLQQRMADMLNKNLEQNSSTNDNQNVISESEKIELQLLRQENQNLRQTLNFLTSHDYFKAEKKSENFLLANVIGQDPLIFSSILILDKGRSNGVKVGDGVIYGEGVLIGKIVGIEENISYLALIINSQVKIAAMISGQENLQGLVEGSHGLSVKLNLIPLDKKIQPGDIIVTSGLEKNILKGLIIGEVKEINTQSNNLFQDITVEPAIDLNNLAIVTILVN